MRNIRLLEERVSRAVKRLRQLSAEKEQLEEELQSLRRQLESHNGATPSGDRDGEEDWRVERAQIVATIRETLADLRAD